MSPRKIAVAALVLVMAASGWYVFVYLYRWEWNRALVSGVIFLAAEVALLGLALVDRIGRVERGIGDLRAADGRVLQRVQEAAPPPGKPFAWLGRASQQSNVFVPVLMGAGVVLSAIAWLVERVARATAGPTLEHGLARRLAVVSLPEGGLLGGAGADAGGVDLFTPRTGP
jgi:hypothetical protein